MDHLLNKKDNGFCKYSRRCGSFYYDGYIAWMCESVPGNTRNVCKSSTDDG